MSQSSPKKKTRSLFCISRVAYVAHLPMLILTVSPLRSRHPVCLFCERTTVFCTAEWYNLKKSRAFNHSHTKSFLFLRCFRKTVADCQSKTTKIRRNCRTKPYKPLAGPLFNHFTYKNARIISELYGSSVLSIKQIDNNFFAYFFYSCNFLTIFLNRISFQIRCSEKRNK